MKKILNLFAIVLLSYSGFAQVTMTDTVVYNPFPKDNNTHILIDTIFNNTPGIITVNWTKSADLLVSGVTGIGMCDPVACYTYAAGPTYSFTINPGSIGIMYVDMKADFTAANGSSYVTISTNYGDMVFKLVTNTPAACQAGFYVYEDSLAAPHTYIGVNTCMGNITSYDWNWGDGTPNATGPYPSHTYAAAGIYNLCLIVTDGINCTDTFCSNENINKISAAWYSVTFQSPTAVTEVIEEEIQLYPNPGTDRLFLRTKNKTADDILLFSISGQQMLSARLKTDESIDISALAKGIYLVKTSDADGKSRYVKYVKQ